jgi:hypothetical protein
LAEKFNKQDRIKGGACGAVAQGANLEGRKFENEMIFVITPKIHFPSCNTIFIFSL